MEHRGSLFQTPQIRLTILLSLLVPKGCLSPMSWCFETF